MRLSHLLWLLVMNVLWSGTYTAYKALAGHLEMGAIVTLRFGFAAIGGIVIWPFLRGPTPRGKDLVRICVIGVTVFTLSPRLQVLALKLGNAGDASLLMALEPLITAVGAAIFLHEKIPARRWFGAGLGIVGVGLMARFWRKDFQFTGLAANLIFVSSFVCETIYSIVGKPVLERAGLMKVIVLSLLAGTLTNLALDGLSSMSAVHQFSTNDAWIFFYLSFICTLFGYAVWYRAIKETDVNIVALTIFAQPICGLAFAVAFLGEYMHLGQLWGGLAIVVGIAIGMTDKRKPAESGTGSH